MSEEDNLSKMKRPKKWEAQEQGRRKYGDIPPDQVS